MKTHSRLLVALFCFAAAALPAAEFTLNPLFSDGAVLQADRSLPVWGTGTPGQTVTVRLLQADAVLAKTEALPDDEGQWMAFLPALPASAQAHKLEAASGSDSLSRSNLLLGDVWLCTGQSNMGTPIRATVEEQSVYDDAAAGRFDHVRLFNTALKSADSPLPTVTGEWRQATPDNLAAFSATAVYFAQGLIQGGVDRPIGLLRSSVGGTNVYSWIRNKTFAADPAAAVARKWWEETVAAGPAALERWETALANWNAKREALIAAGATPAQATAQLDRAPREPMHATSIKRPTGFYNGMIAPLQPYAVRGAIWYQGEGNSRAPWATSYAAFLDRMVEDWQTEWTRRAGGDPGQPERFPFYAVQLPAYGGGDPEGWPVIREQFVRFAEDREEAGYAVTIDSGVRDDIHPKDKHVPGHRLALVALARTYGKDIVASGPRLAGFEIAGDTVELAFEDVAEGLRSRDGEPLRHFEIAGEDRVFHPAEASIQGSLIRVSATAVSQPAAVRYAWTPWPENGVNFENSAGLPAGPFRTDDWDFPALTATATP